MRANKRNHRKRNKALDSQIRLAEDDASEKWGKRKHILLAKDAYRELP